MNNSYRRYSCMLSEVIGHTLQGGRVFRALDVYHPWIIPTVKDLHRWIDSQFPDLVITSPADKGFLLPDAARALDLYKHMTVLLSGSDGRRYELMMMEV